VLFLCSFRTKNKKNYLRFAHVAFVACQQHVAKITCLSIFDNKKIIIIAMTDEIKKKEF
jgi:hypothetical protein